MKPSGVRSQKANHRTAKIRQADANTQTMFLSDRLLSVISKNIPIPPARTRQKMGIMASKGMLQSHHFYYRALFRVREWLEAKTGRWVA
jgi:hypothetical protein